MGKGTNDKKEVKIEFTAVTDKIDEAMVALSTRFGTLAKSISAGINVASSEIKGKITETNMKLDLTNDKLLLISESTAGLKKTISDGFGSLNNILTSNHAKMDSIVQKLVAMHQQTRNIASANQVVKKTNDDINDSLLGTFSTLKLMNVGWNLIFNAIKQGKNELIELEKQVSVINNLTGESSDRIKSQIISLSNASGFAIGEIGKALIDAANKGNNVDEAFAKINAGIVLSSKNMGSLGSNISHIDNIVDEFGITADKALGLIIGKNLSSEKSLTIFERLGKEAKEAGIGVDQFTSMLNILSNQAGLSQRALQSGFKGVLDSLQKLGETGQKEFLTNILPNWTKLNEATQKSILLHMGLKEGDEIVNQLGQRYKDVTIDIKHFNDNEQTIIDRAKSNPDTLAKQLNAGWNNMISLMDTFINKANNFLPVLSGYYQILKAFNEWNAVPNLSKWGELQDRIGKINTELEQMDRGLIDRSTDERLNLLKERADIKKQLISINDDETKKSVQGFDSYKTALNGVHASLNKILGTTAFTVKINEQLVTGPKEANSEYEKLFQNESKVNKTQSEYVDIQKGHLQGLYTELTLTQKEMGIVQSRIAQEKVIGHDKEYTITLSKNLTDLEEHSANLQLSILKEINKEKKAGITEHKRDLKEIQSDILNDYKARHDMILTLRQDGKINASEEVTMLKMIEGILYSQTDAKLRIVDAEKEQSKILKVNSDEYQNQLKSLNALEQTTHRRTEEFNLKIDRAEVARKSKGAKLTDKQEIGFAQEDVALAKKYAKDVGATSRDEINETQDLLEKQVADFEKNGRKMTGDEQKEARIQIDITKDDLATKISAFDKEYSAESALMAKKMALYEKTHVIQLDLQKVLASNLEKTVGSVIDKLIFNTGSLSHIWTDLVKQIVADMAKKELQKGIEMMLTGGESGGGGIIGAIGDFFGFSSGTSVHGVPGYAKGSSGKGVDSVLSMLSPGEIVLDNNASDMFRGLMKNGMTTNLVDMMRHSKSSQSGQKIEVHVHSSPSLLGNRHEVIQLDKALNNPLVRSYTDRRKI